MDFLSISKANVFIARASSSKREQKDAAHPVVELTVLG